MIDVPYAVTCACPGFDGMGITDAQQRTVVISHELVEAATDPLPADNPAFVQEDDNDYVWTLVTSGEVADMCYLNDDTYYIPPGATHMVQRTWSNAQAALMHNPCVPHTTTDSYFNTFAALGPVSYTPPGYAPFTTQGVSIPIGQSQSIDVHLYGGQPTPGPWQISACTTTTPW